jgi:hypothetical protein
MSERYEETCVLLFYSLVGNRQAHFFIMHKVMVRLLPHLDDDWCDFRTMILVCFAVAGY